MKQKPWKRLWRLSFALAFFSVACMHHVTVPKTTPDPAIGHEHTILKRVVPCAISEESTNLKDADTWRTWCLRGSL